MNLRQFVLSISMEDLITKFNTKFPAQTAAVCSAAKSDKLAHAYIVYSDNPEIREEFSIFLGQVASCPTPKESGLPCNQCKVCQQLQEGSYAELFTLQPVAKSRQITIGQTPDEPDSLRWFQNFFYMSSVSPGAKKVGIIRYADCLNVNAQNAFLKTLEEPPTKSIFILNTGNPFALLPTIRSRCHIITLLENFCKYQFSGQQDMIHALMRLQSEKANLAVSEDCAQILIDISNNLKKEAEANIQPKWQPRLDDAANSDLQMTLAMKKRIKEQHEAAIQAEYLKLREFYLSLIHTWFAQSYQMACGGAMENLSNSDIYQHLDIKHSIVDEEYAYKCLIKAEKLLQNLRWNVNEELAIREFCCSFHL